ncbi:hemerythrin domain-containing protein [Clostridium sp. UBA7503]|uniref:hemerythrin domain-containing protein n=1 Tax=Clostridium sp. UBA7503 TaxID=1946377 RepID=UPI0032171E8F
MNLNNLMRQHRDISDEIRLIKEMINKNVMVLNAMEAASHINKLAGKLQIHLTSEDKFLYPTLINGKDLSLKKMANLYMNEMGEISEVFTSYKKKFNTKNKIEANLMGFIEETQCILKAIETRIAKEENELYKMMNVN